MEEVEKDSRFAHVIKDPRFHKMPRKERKVKIDQRFNAMFKDKKFKLKYAVDKRGRPMNLTTNDHLKKYYDISDSEDSGVEESGDKLKKKSKKKEKVKKEKPDHELVKSTKKKKEKTKGEVVKTNQVSVKDLNTNLSEKLGKNKKDEQVSVSQNKNRDRSKNLLSKPSTAVKNIVQHESSDDSDLSDADNDEDDKDDSLGGEEDDDDNLDQSEDDEDVDDDDEDQSSSEIEAHPTLKPGDGPDLSRGEGLEASSSEDTDFEEDDEEVVDASDSHWGELDKDAPVAKDISSRLAICNMDWDRMQAEDVYILLNSFKPVGSVIKSVKIYLSEFGKQRIAEEEVKGPIELVKKEESDGEGGDDHDSRERLRQYQLSRLKYYYAVVVCDSPQTANHIYEQCDGLEYESSSTRLDLRFIPDDMKFEEKPRSEIDEMPTTYKQSVYVTTALNQSKVDLTWDEDDKNRVSVTRRKITPEELMDLDVKEYLASSGSESEGDPYGDFIDRGSDQGVVDSDSEDEEKSVEKYKRLLQGLDVKESKGDEKNMEMEITWEPGLKETTESLVKKSAQKKEDSTPWDQYMEKKKEKKKEKREMRKQERLMKKQKQNDGDNLVSDDEVPVGVDLNDPYFAEELASTDLKPGKKNKKKKQSIEETGEEKQKKAELSMLMTDEDDGKQHFNLKSIMEKEGGATKKKKKNKKKRQLDEQDTEGMADNFEVDTKDTRFDALYSSHLYNIDPSSAEFKKTKAMEKLMQEKVQRRKDKSFDNKKSKTELASPPKQDGVRTVVDAALSSLIKSVKAKTQFHQEKRKKKQKTS